MTNTDVERYYFERFRKDYKLPEGTIQYGDKPDVVLHGVRRIGIEVTRLFLKDGALPESEQVQQKLRESVVAHAQQIYQAENGKRFELSFGFDAGKPIRSQRTLARQLVSLARAVESCSTGQLDKYFYKDIPELDFVYLNADGYADATWRHAQTYSTPLTSKVSLQKVIATKEEKSRCYSHCDAYWLLVVVDFFDRAQDQEIRLDVPHMPKSNVFERIHRIQNVSSAHSGNQVTLD